MATRKLTHRQYYKILIERLRELVAFAEDRQTISYLTRAIRRCELVRDHKTRKPPRPSS